MPTAPKIIWLFLAANTSRDAHLELDEEFRLLREKLLRSKHRDRFDIQMIPAARPEDLRQELLLLRPTVVHFSGHGSRAGIVLRNETGHDLSVGPTALTRLFKDRGVSLVVLNSCHSSSG